MPRVSIVEQADLFGADPDDPGAPAPSAPITADFMARIRAELQATLARVRAAKALPWPNLTKTYLAELRFDSIATWLPGDEARALKDAFGIEMERLYRAAGEARPGRATPQ